MDNILNTLEFEKIKNELKSFSVSDLGKKLIEKLEPSTDIDRVSIILKQTSEAKKILNKSPHVPLHGLHNIEECLEKIEKGGVLQPTELIKIYDFLRGCRKIKKFMKGQELVAPTLSSYAQSISIFEEIEGEINTSIEGNSVSSRASSKLEKIRKKIDIVEGRIEQKLQNIISSPKYKPYIQEFFISKRNDRYVIPIKSAYKNMVEGTVIDKSATGATTFIEPAAVGTLSNELKSLKADEEAEEYQVLATISGYISLYIREIRINLEVMAEYDFDFAKGKYSNYLRGIEPKINDNDYIKIVKGRHPLLGDKAVPLDFEIGKSYRTLVITGPNTGGKTVALKTVGLLTLMTQSGLHIPAEEGTEIAVFRRIFADIGDNQSIEQSLSTFSGHIKNIIDIINKASISTLVLLDEIGTGTDPEEGSALAIAILDELYACGAITVVTTHYGEIKDYSEQHSGYENGCMEFEPNTLEPLYKLIIGRSGKSNALWIAERFGMKKSILQNAKKYMESKGDNNRKIKFDIEQNKIEFNRKKPKKIKNTINEKSEGENYEVGDSVILLDSNQKGIVYKTEDDFGNLIIQIKDEFIKVNKKRVKIFIKRQHLYPEGYDLDTVFVPWSIRKFEKDVKRGALRNPQEFRERFNKIREEDKKDI